MLAAVYSLILIQKAFHGRPQKADAHAHGHGEAETKYEDLNHRELGMMALLMVLLLGLGLYPQPVLDVSQAAMQTVQMIYNSPAAVATTGVMP